MAVSPQQLLALPPALPANESYSFSVLAKAKPDEWFTGTEDAQGKYTSGPYYALGTQPANVTGREKVNQDYVWGMAEANGKIFFSSSGNVLTQAARAIGNAGTAGYMDGIHVSEGSSSQYPQQHPRGAEAGPGRLAAAADARLQHGHRPVRNITPTSASAVAPERYARPALGGRHRLTSSSMPGPQLTYIGMNVFAFDAKTNAISRLDEGPHLQQRPRLGQCERPALHGRAAHVLHHRPRLGAALDGHAQLALQLPEVARLDAEAANIAVHNNRLFVSHLAA